MSSPFEKNIVISYYDGPIEGLVECSVCRKSWLYKMIAWDTGQDERVFVLSELPEGSFEFVEQFFRAVQPDYSGGLVKWVFASELLKAFAGMLIQRTIASASEPRWIVLGKSISAPLSTRIVDAEVAEALSSVSTTEHYEDLRRWYKYFPQRSAS